MAVVELSSSCNQG